MNTNEPYEPYELAQGERIVDLPEGNGEPEPHPTAKELTEMHRDTANYKLVKSLSDDVLRKELDIVAVFLEEYRHDKGRYSDAIGGWENYTLDELLWCEEYLSMNTPEFAVLDVLLWKKDVEGELQRRWAE